MQPEPDAEAEPDAAAVGRPPLAAAVAPLSVEAVAEPDAEVAVVPPSAEVAVPLSSVAAAEMAALPLAAVELSAAFPAAHETARRAPVSMP